jgi:hypothetical protein
MIDSINPRNLLDFCLDTAWWFDNRTDSVMDELDEVEHVINTFCSNNEDPLYMSANLLAAVMIAALKDIRITPKEEIEETEPIEETEDVKDDNSR